ncbi:MAG TPA: hypothetical protein VFF49_06680 [Thermodesulfobacteriota bacterium]|nr:hypothetical protein [Thermodesulfobacteriota bacterium]
MDVIIITISVIALLACAAWIITIFIYAIRGIFGGRRRSDYGKTVTRLYRDPTRDIPDVFDERTWK